MSFFESIGRAIMLKKLRPHIRSYLLKAGITSEPYDMFGMLFLGNIVVCVLVFFLAIYPFISNQAPIFLVLWTFLGFTGLAFVMVAVMLLIIYFYLDLIIYHRTAQIEDILPDYLQLVSTNVKSGMSFEKSLWLAIKPRFGVLAIEMEMVLKKVMTGHDLGDSLTEFGRKYNSPMVRRAISLLSGELDSGGKISHILDGLTANLKNNQKMKAEMAASVITYMIFIGAIVIIISPALFALSFNLLSFMDSFVAKIAEQGSTASSPFPIKAGAIKLDEFKIFSFSAVLIVSIFSSLIVSVIEKGNIKAGLKYIPIFSIGAVFCYLMFMIILQAIFGNIVI